MITNKMARVQNSRYYACDAIIEETVNRLITCSLSDSGVPAKRNCELMGDHAIKLINLSFVDYLSLTHTLLATATFQRQCFGNLLSILLKIHSSLVPHGLLLDRPRPKPRKPSDGTRQNCSDNTVNSRLNHSHNQSSISVLRLWLNHQLSGDWL